MDAGKSVLGNLPADRRKQRGREQQTDRVCRQEGDRGGLLFELRRQLYDKVEVLHIDGIWARQVAPPEGEDPLPAEGPPHSLPFSHTDFLESLQVRQLPSGCRRTLKNALLSSAVTWILGEKLL